MTFIKNIFILYQTKLDFGAINDSVEAYLIEGGKEEQKIRELMK